MSEANVSTPAFVDHVKEVLENLYDFAFLEGHPFALLLSARHRRAGESGGQCLRRLILGAIERLNPGAGLALRATHARAYNMLHLRYVEGMTTHEAANEIGISKRQAYRQLVSAREELAALLQSLYPELADDEPAPPLADSPAPYEMKINARPVDISALVQYATAAVARLAEQNNLTLHSVLPDEPLTLLTDSTIAKQILVSTLSRCVQSAHQGAVTLTLRNDAGGWVLYLEFPLEAEAAPAPVISPVAEQLVGSLGWKIEQHHSPTTGIVRLYFEAKVVTLLVIDDDEGLGELIERYLTGQSYNVVVALSGEDGLRLAEELLPEVVVLDVMIPHMDGWEVLQRLRAKPETRQINIVICSIFNDPELAFSLGAADVLTKPLSQNALLEALQSLDL